MVTIYVRRLSYVKYRDLYYPVNESVAKYQTNDFSFDSHGGWCQNPFGYEFHVGFKSRRFTFSDNLDGSFPTFVDEINQQPHLETV